MSNAVVVTPPPLVQTSPFSAAIVEAVSANYTTQLEVVGVRRVRTHLFLLRVRREWRCRQSVYDDVRATDAW